MLTHDLIKMKYVREGYLPNYPYHLISDQEMFDAFLPHERGGFFSDMYPCKYESLRSSYNDLIAALRYHINNYLTDELNEYEMPDWIYSYMLGVCVTFTSPDLDKHDMLVLAGLDNVDDELTEEVLTYILQVSTDWVAKLPNTKNDHRPPTMFGEPHVIKSLRLMNG